jgi:hypothetical protein
MIRFYDNKIPLINFIKISIMIQKIGAKNYFSAIEHLHTCIKNAGFNYLNDFD